jgi:2-keto-3-deoxy-L-rhamnonate aldolase RhmA
MAVRPNKTLRKLQAGDRAIGAETATFHQGVPLLYAEAGLDYIWIDLEHTLVNPERVAATIQFSRFAGITPIVRIPELQPGLVRSLLDNGAQGIILPLVEDAGVVEELVSWCQFHPGGKRGVGNPLFAHDYGDTSLVEHVEQSEAEVLVAVQVESLSGVDAIDEISAVEGLDVAILGLADLSVSCGVPGDVKHPKVIEAGERVLEAVTRRGVAGGVAGFNVHTYDGPALTAWAERGARFLQLFGDLGLLADVTLATVKDAQAALSKLPSGP